MKRPVVASHGSRLILVRHARSAHVQAGWLDARGFRDWRSAYEAAGIAAEERPPQALGELARQADLLVASDSPRALASVRLLAGAREVRVSPLLRELELTGPELGALRLPLLGWALAVGASALVRRLRGEPAPPNDLTRLREAKAWLDELAAAHVLIVVVTHASFRTALARELAFDGWSAEPGPRTLKPWSAWSFRRQP